jgi:hypothetical protein
LRAAASLGRRNRGRAKFELVNQQAHDSSGVVREDIGNPEPDRGG